MTAVSRVVSDTELPCPSAPILRRSSEPVLELIDDPLDFSFGAAAGISVSAFEQIHEIVLLAIDPVEIVRAELSPVVVHLVTKLFPLCAKNVHLHS
jgi:hypothetical protein